MRRKTIVFCLILLLAVSCSLTAFSQTPEHGRACSFSVTLADQSGSEPMVGAELNLYMVASVEVDPDGVLLYTFTDDFADLDTSPDDPDITAKLDVFVTDSDISSLQLVTDEHGTATCAELDGGLYFVKQTKEVEGFAMCKPFTVTLPAKVGGEYVYDVNATPKTDVEKLTSVTVRKIWNTDGSVPGADSVTVELLRDGTVVKSAVLSAENNWKVTYADMPASDAYSIVEVDIPDGYVATYSHNGYEFTVTNTASLIQTGQLIWPIPVLAATGILLIAAGSVLLIKKRKKDA